MSAATRGTSPPDAILERFLSDMTQDDYAGTPAPLPGPTARRPTAWLALAVAVVIGLVITAALWNARLSTAERGQTRAALEERVQVLAGTVAERQAAVDATTAQVQGLREALLAESDAGPARASEITVLSAQAGTSALEGPGVVITLDDAPGAEVGSLNRVLDRDLQDVVNALWQEGATGIAVNGQRLTADTAIRNAGEAILVNYQPLTRPYVIAAVGARAASAPTSGPRVLLDGLSSDYGLVGDLDLADVALPAGELRSPRFAAPDPQLEGGSP
ncbi:MAG: DUF881 domain-containing protein [Actinomycetota bacterium]|nr:DUF881 domain-containing protein [Actinomycetota bacterium]